MKVKISRKKFFKKFIDQPLSFKVWQWISRNYRDIKRQFVKDLTKSYYLGRLSHIAEAEKSPAKIEDVKKAYDLLLKQYK